MKNWNFNSDSARCTRQDRGVSGLLVNGAGSGDHDLVDIADRRRVGNARKEHCWTRDSSVQEREGTRGGKHTAVAWIVDGDQLIRCSTAHMRPFTNAEQTLCSLGDGDTTSFQEIGRNLPRRNYVASTC